MVLFFFVFLFFFQSSKDSRAPGMHSMRLVNRKTFFFSPLKKAETILSDLFPRNFDVISVTSSRIVISIKIISIFSRKIRFCLITKIFLSRAFPVGNYFSNVVAPAIFSDCVLYRNTSKFRASNIGDSSRSTQERVWRNDTRHCATTRVLPTRGTVSRWYQHSAAVRRCIANATVHCTSSLERAFGVSARDVPITTSLAC